MDEPITPGYYWAQFNDTDSIHITIIVKVTDIYGPQRRVYMCGNKTNYRLEDFVFLERIPPYTEQIPKVMVRYWTLNTRSYSIDRRPSRNAELAGIEVPLSETYTKNGERYYRMVSGHGDYIDLLVE